MVKEDIINAVKAMRWLGDIVWSAKEGYMRGAEDVSLSAAAASRIIENVDDLSEDQILKIISPFVKEFFDSLTQGGLEEPIPQNLSALHELRNALLSFRKGSEESSRHKV